MENTMTMSKSYEQKLLERRSELFEQAPGEEAVEKREESVKHFRLGPGRYQAVVYAEPVHYRRKAPVRGRRSTTTWTTEQTKPASPSCATAPTSCAWS